MKKYIITEKERDETIKLMSYRFYLRAKNMLYGLRELKEENKGEKIKNN